LIISPWWPQKYPTHLSPHCAESLHGLALRARGCIPQMLSFDITCIVAVHVQLLGMLLLPCAYWSGEAHAGMHLCVNLKTEDG
jgi:hypothetical protein